MKMWLVHVVVWMVGDMVKVVSVVPKENDKDGVHICQGTQILLSDGNRLEGVHKVTLVAEADNVWRAIIEVFPKNQTQIDALLSDLKVLGHETATTKTTATSSEET